VLAVSVMCAKQRCRRNAADDGSAATHGVAVQQGMLYDPEKNDHGIPHNPFKSLIVPRPIGWISTVSAEGKAVTAAAGLCGE